MTPYEIAGQWYGEAPCGCGRWRSDARCPYAFVDASARPFDVIRPCSRHSACDWNERGEPVKWAIIAMGRIPPLPWQAAAVLERFLTASAQSSTVGNSCR